MGVVWVGGHYILPLNPGSTPWKVREKQSFFWVPRWQGDERKGKTPRVEPIRRIDLKFFFIFFRFFFPTPVALRRICTYRTKVVSESMC